MTATFPEGITLTPRTLPIIAYDKKFCPLENSKLLITLKPGLKEGIKFQVRDGDTNNLKYSCFKSTNKWKSVFHERILKEEEDVGEELMLRRKLVAIHNQTFLYNKNDHLLCTFTNCSGPVSSDKAKITAEFREATQARKPRLMVLKGKLGETKYCTIYLGDPKKEGVRPVGKMTGVKVKDNKKVNVKDKGAEENYHLEVAGGIDLLVILGMCVNFLVEKFKAPNAHVAPLK